jgi:chemotaxis regulatin CheY-phosphate phosphatase CheZ
MKDRILDSLVKYFQGKITRHVVNIEVMLNNPMAIHDHTDLTGAIEKELEIIAEYEEKLTTLNKYFGG